MWSYFSPVHVTTMPDDTIPTPTRRAQSVPHVRLNQNWLEWILPGENSFPFFFFCNRGLQSVLCISPDRRMRIRHLCISSAGNNAFPLEKWFSLQPWGQAQHNNTETQSLQAQTGLSSPGLNWPVRGQWRTCEHCLFKLMKSWSWICHYRRE